MKEQLKLLLTTKKGWFSWIVANIITSLHWAIPLFIGWIIGDNQLMAFAISLWGIGMLPFVPLWLINIIIALWIIKKIR